MKQKLYCFNRWKKEDYFKDQGWITELPRDCACIDICGTLECQKYVLEEEENHYFSESTPNVCNLDFDDIGSEVMKDQGHTYLGISGEQAKTLVQFIESNKDKNFYINCRAGKSRSQGVVRYILDTYYDTEWELNPDNPCYTPNLYVTGKLKEANRELYGIQGWTED